MKRIFIVIFLLLLLFYLNNLFTVKTATIEVDKLMHMVTENDSVQSVDKWTITVQDTFNDDLSEAMAKIEHKYGKLLWEKEDTTYVSNDSIIAGVSTEIKLINVNLKETITVINFSGVKWDRSEEKAIKNFFQVWQLTKLSKVFSAVHGTEKKDAKKNIEDYEKKWQAILLGQKIEGIREENMSSLSFYSAKFGKSLDNGMNLQIVISDYGTEMKFIIGTPIIISEY